MGDIGLVAALLTKAFGFAVDPTGYAAKSREAQLEQIMEGIDAAILKNDPATADALFAEYRQLRQKT